MRRRTPHSKAPHIHPLRPIQYVVQHPPRQNHPRIRAQLPRRILHVLPSQARPPRHNVVVQKNQRLRRIDAQPFQARRGPITVNVVHAHKPPVLRIGNRQSFTRSLIRRMRACHIVRNRPQVASLGQIQRPLLFCHHVPPQQQPSIVHAVNVFRHLALPAAARPLVHQDQLVLIRSHHRHRRAMIRRPSLPLALVQQHRVDSLLRARSRVQVVCKNLLVSLRPVMHHHLPSAKMRMPERRRHKQDSACHLEMRRHLAARNHPLQIGQRGGKESRPEGQEGRREKTR